MQMRLAFALCAIQCITLALCPVPLDGKKVFSDLFGRVIRLAKFFQRSETSVEVSEDCALLLFVRHFALSVVSDQAKD